jgi:3-hydroxyacyl-CoA dehydrogenase/enoyl-CoA hydratase/3-hydroxybutyryl-CoA epimerase
MLGRKNGAGFYVHEKSKAHPNLAVTQFAQGQSAAGYSREELQERMVFLMVNESARCLEEQIVTAPEDVDFAMINGTGFAPFRGGPLRYADSLGAEKIVGAMDNLVDRGADHFAPCNLLKQMAAVGKKFYGN